MAKAYDVVCGMEVDTGTALSAEHEETTYYFCCDGCRGAFQRSPDYHLANWKEDHPDMTSTP